MSDSSQAIWWVFISGLVVLVLLLTGFAAAMVLSQRRYLELHRNHARRILEAQEEERAWVSREVHDDAVQRLVLIGRECALLGASEPPVTAQQAKQLGAIQSELEDLGIFLRDLAHRLHPALIDRGGLHAALAGLCEEMERAYELRIEPRLPPPDQQIRWGPQRALVLYRIAQEAIHNVAKHAGVKAATLELSATSSEVVLVVSDSGRGFEMDRRDRSGGIGLIGMRERAYLAGGDVEVDSQPGGGTRVRVRFPLDRDDAV